jgi:hypothetical protein
MLCKSDFNECLSQFPEDELITLQRRQTFIHRSQSLTTNPITTAATRTVTVKASPNVNRLASIETLIEVERHQRTFTSSTAFEPKSVTTFLTSP